MKQITIQIQPDRAPQLSPREVRAVLADVAATVPLVHQHWFEEGEDGGQYFDFFFETEDIDTLELLLATFKSALEGPFFSPYNVAPERQYVLFYVRRLP